jgi:hypothetical protein
MQIRNFNKKKETVLGVLLSTLPGTVQTKARVMAIPPKKYCFKTDSSCPTPLQQLEPNL